MSTEAAREGGIGGLRRIGLGVAGLGRIGLMHAENLAGPVPSAALVRVVDADEARARTAGQQLDVDWSTSYEDLLADPEVHGVVIATPTALHVEMVERAAAAGKHIFCEKPISLDLSSTLAAIDVARAAAERIHAGELGDVYFFRATLRDKQPPPMEYIKASGGFFVDVTIHDLDAARWLVGEIEEVTAHGAALSDPAFEAAGDVDNAVVVLRFANGALGVIDESRVAGYGYDCSTEVLGSRATVRVGDHRRTGAAWLTPGTAAVDWVEDFTERFPQAYALELEEFALSIRDGRAPAVTGEDGLAAFVLAQACERSYREQRTVKLRHEEHVGRVIYEAA